MFCDGHKKKLHPQFFESKMKVILATFFLAAIQIAISQLENEEGECLVLNKHLYLHHKFDCK